MVVRASDSVGLVSLRTLRWNHATWSINRQISFSKILNSFDESQHTKADA